MNPPRITDVFRFTLGIHFYTRFKLNDQSSFIPTPFLLHIFNVYYIHGLISFNWLIRKFYFDLHLIDNSNKCRLLHNYRCSCNSLGINETQSKLRYA